MKFTLPKRNHSPKSVRYGERLNPERDWILLSTAAGVLLLVSIAWNVWLFYRVTNGDALGNAPPQASLNPASVDPITALFQKRADAETEYKNTHFVDPSTPTR